MKKKVINCIIELYGVELFIKANFYFRFGIWELETCNCLLRNDKLCYLFSYPAKNIHISSVTVDAPTAYKVYRFVTAFTFKEFIESKLVSLNKSPLVYIFSYKDFILSFKEMRTPQHNFFINKRK